MRSKVITYGFANTPKYGNISCRTPKLRTSGRIFDSSQAFSGAGGPLPQVDLTLDGSRPGYVALWPVDEIAGNNTDVEIETYAPGFLAFAGDGGGERLAFVPTGAVFMLPMIGMTPACAERIADRFLDLAKRFKS